MAEDLHLKCQNAFARRLTMRSIMEIYELCAMILKRSLKICGSLRHVDIFG